MRSLRAARRGFQKAAPSTYTGAFPVRDLRVRIVSEPGMKNETVEAAIGGVVANLARDVRDILLPKWEAEVVRRARANIRAGNVGTGYRLTGKLEASVQAIGTDGDTAVVTYGAGLPQAVNLNKPRGTYTTIWPNGRFLVFPNRKRIAIVRGRKTYVPKKIYAKSVQWPGKAFFDDAVAAANEQLPMYLKEAVAQASPRYGGSGFRLLEQGGKIKLGPRSRTARTRRDSAAQ